VDLSEFFARAEATVEHPEMRQWLAELLARRQQSAPRVVQGSQTAEPATTPSPSSSS
jgi:hypothetical protein